MDDVAVGIIVGVVVALAGQVIATVADRIKERREEQRRAKAVVRLLRHEVEGHRALYEHHLAWAQESIAKGGEGYTGYSYQGAKTDAYDRVFLADWHALPDEILRPVMDYYGTVHAFNLLSGYFGTPTSVPIGEAKRITESAKRSAEGLLPLLEKHAPGP